MSTAPASPPSANDPFARLPEAARAPLRRLQDTLAARLGKKLVSLLVFGSAARGGFRNQQSDIDVLLVLEDTAPETLAGIAAALRLARDAARIEAVILSVEETRRAADVFPLFYEDIHRCHVALAGSDPFAGLSIDAAHRRLRIEQELREAQIRLRRVVVDTEDAPLQLAGAVIRKVRQVRSPLFAFFVQSGKNIDDGIESVLTEAGQRYGLDVAWLARPDRIREAPAQAAALLGQRLRAAVDEVDRLGGA